MNDRVDRFLSVTLTAAALLIAGSVLYRTVAPVGGQSAAEAPRLAAVSLPSWDEALAAGVRVGPADAPVTIVEITDLECPACRAFDRTLKAVLQKYPTQVAAVYVSYPLEYHRFAMSAARAADCAEREGRYGEFVSAVFAKQDSLGLRGWGAYAADAGILDTTRISACAAEPAPVARIEAGKAYGDKIEVTGTPTVIVNGWRLTSPPGQAELERIVTTLLAGDEPFPSAD